MPRAGSLILGDDQYCTVIEGSDEHDLLDRDPGSCTDRRFGTVAPTLRFRGTMQGY